MAGSDARRARELVHSLVRRARDARAELAGVQLPPAPPTPPAAPRPLDVNDALAVFDALVTDDGLRLTTRQLYADGHYARAVEEAYKYVNNAVKGRAGSPADGKPMMFAVFDQDRPVLRLSRLRSMSEKDEQEGYKFVFGGCMQGVRNPRAHEHDLRDEAGPALEMIVWANHLMRVLARTTRTRRRRGSRTP